MKKKNKRIKNKNTYFQLPLRGDKNNLRFRQEEGSLPNSEEKVANPIRTSTHSQ